MPAILPLLGGILGSATLFTLGQRPKGGAAGATGAPGAPGGIVPVNLPAGGGAGAFPAGTPIARVNVTIGGASLNVRSEPSPANPATVIANLPNGTIVGVRATGIPEQGPNALGAPVQWWQITLADGRSGFVRGIGPQGETNLTPVGNVPLPGPRPVAAIVQPAAMAGIAGVIPRGYKPRPQRSVAVGRGGGGGGHGGGGHGGGVHGGHGGGGRFFGRGGFGWGGWGGYWPGYWPYGYGACQTYYYPGVGYQTICPQPYPYAVI